jgi:hypothetical protein
MGGGDDVIVDGPDAAAAMLAFTSPAPGATEARDFLADDGFLVADVAMAVTFDGTADAIEISVGDVVLGQADGNGALTGLLRDLGTQTVTARALVGDAVVAEATVDIMVVEPSPADCHGWLDLYGLEYTLGPANAGVSDPVTVTTPINGMVHRYTSNTTPRTTFFMDCTLARSLAKAAAILRAHDVVEVADIGVYNYRCIGGEGTPPDCPQGISQHAYAKAIDLAAFKTSDSTVYTVNTDWIIDPDAEDTCAAPTVAGKDAWLHQLICELKAAGTWNIVLTPNYNAAHRDHFHVDLTTGANFIEKRLPMDQGPDDL